MAVFVGLFQRHHGDDHTESRHAEAKGRGRESKGPPILFGARENATRLGPHGDIVGDIRTDSAQVLRIPSRAKPCEAIAEAIRPSIHGLFFNRHRYVDAGNGLLAASATNKISADDRTSSVIFARVYIGRADGAAGSIVTDFPLVELMKHRRVEARLIQTKNRGRNR